MEILYCNKWTRTEGLAALIITPTRELAYQIFETLRKIGIHHDFSAGLIIGECIMSYNISKNILITYLSYFRWQRFEIRAQTFRPM